MHLPHQNTLWVRPLSPTRCISNVLSVRTIDRTTSALLFALGLVGLASLALSLFALFRLTVRTYILATGFCIGTQHRAGVAAARQLGDLGSIQGREALLADE